MDKFASIDALTEAAAGALSHASATVGAFLPKLLGAVLILVAGWIASRLIEAVARRLLVKLGADRLSRRLNLDEGLRRAGVEHPASWILGRSLFWLVMLTFVLSAVDALGLQGVIGTVAKLVAFIPHVVGALLIVVLGLVVGHFGRAAVTSGAAVADAGYGRRLGSIVYFGSVAAACVLALGQLGIDADLLVAVVTAAVAAATMGAGLAFALGARGVIAHVLAGHFLRQRLKVGEEIQALGLRGVVVATRAVDTVIRTEESTVSIPNATLLEEVVVR